VLASQFTSAYTRNQNGMLFELSNGNWQSPCSFTIVMSKSVRLYWLSLAVVIIGTLLRFTYLDADPRYYEWVGYITDEGRWVQHARNLALHGHLIDSASMNFHLFMAPLFQLSNYLVFELFGMSVLTTRLFTAFCGSAVLAVFWDRLRRVVTPEGLLAGVALLALQCDLLALSRVAVPEMVAMSFELAVYFILVSDISRNMVAAGFLLLVACGMKATEALLLPIFAIVILSMPRKAGDTGPWRDLMLFLIGFLMPALVAGAIGYFFISDRIGDLFDNMAGFVALIQSFLGLSKLYLYNVIRFPFEDPLSYTFNFYSLGIWLTILLWWANGSEKIDFRLQRYLATSATWFGLYFVLMLSLNYFPTRYKVHILMPMVVFITIGMTVIQNIGVGEMVQSIAKRKSRVGFLWLFILGLPTAAFLSPLLMFLINLTGVESDRLSVKLFCFVFLLVAVTYLVQRVKGSRRAVTLFLIFPFVEALIWVGLSTAEKFVPFWPITGFRLHATYLSLVILFGIGISFAIAKVIDQWSAYQGSRIVTAAAICYLIVALIRLSPGYLDRHYSIRDSSQDLAKLLPASAIIATFKAETLFNNNNLRYSSLSGRRGERPEFIVLAFDFSQLKNIDKEYSLMRTYDLWISPEYDYSDAKSREHSVDSGIVPLADTNQTGQAVVARVYQHIDRNPTQ